MASRIVIGTSRAQVFSETADVALSGGSGAAKMLIKTINQAKRILRIVFGFTLLVLGVAMFVTPGPGWLTVLLGLGVLAAEFVWARRLLDRLKQEGARLRDTVFPRRAA